MSGPRARRNVPTPGAFGKLQEEVDTLARLAHESIVELGHRNDALAARVEKLEQALVAAREAGTKKNGGGILIVP